MNLTFEHQNFRSDFRQIMTDSLKRFTEMNNNHECCFFRNNYNNIH